jgi:hypothetical protein
MPHAVFGRAAHAGQSNGNRGDENNFAHGGHVVKIDDIAAAKGTAMKLAGFQVSGRNSYGAVVGDGVVDLGRRLGERYPTLRAAIAGDALGRFAAEVSTEVGGIGVLRNPIVAES